jgi:hypothetical protein
MLIDEGDVNVKATKAQWATMGAPSDRLDIKKPYPDESKTPVGWIIDYMNEFWPEESRSNMALEYLLLSHFHSDHFGDGSAEQTDRTKSPSGNYLMSGIPELASKFNIKKIIDRGFPSYDVPQDLRLLHDKSTDNYLHFVDENKNALSFEQFQVGSTEQVKMQRNPGAHDFQVRIIKSGLQVASPFDPKLAKGVSANVEKIPGEVLNENGHGNENTMSAAIVIEYGGLHGFKYYYGADQEIVRNANGDVVLDTIGPTARAAGKVDVGTLNHHGHGVSKDYMTELDPPVMILQGWSSDQPPNQSLQLIRDSHPVGRVKPRIFATDIFQERLDGLGPTLRKLIKSTSGHVLVRAHPPIDINAPMASLRGSVGNQQTYEVIVLDGDRRIKKHYGHYPVRDK